MKNTRPAYLMCINPVNRQPNTYGVIRGWNLPEGRPVTMPITYRGITNPSNSHPTIGMRFVLRKTT